MMPVGKTKGGERKGKGKQNLKCEMFSADILLFLQERGSFV